MANAIRKFCSTCKNYTWWVNKTCAKCGGGLVEAITAALRERGKHETRS